MKLSRCLLTLLLSHACTATLLADRWGPIRQTEFYSLTRKYMLKIEPEATGSIHPGHCRATMYCLVGQRNAVWSRYLINDYAPVQVFVADSGRYVVTMDDWHHVGKFPLVVYSDGGKLVRVHEIDSLGLKGDVLHIKISASSFWWNEHSISFFGPDENTFFVRLHWGKLLMFDLRDGSLVDQRFYETRSAWDTTKEKWESLCRYADSRVRESALDLLDASDLSAFETGILVCKQLDIQGAVPKLKSLLERGWPQSEDLFGGLVREYYVRKAAREALRALGVEPDHQVTEQATGE